MFQGTLSHPAFVLKELRASPQPEHQMAIAKITIRTVERLKPRSRVWDTVVQGFGVRRQTDGAYYYLRFRRNGAQTMRSIGRHGSPWTPDTARNEAKRLLGLAVSGDDPFAKPVCPISWL